MSTGDMSELPEKTQPRAGGAASLLRLLPLFLLGLALIVRAEGLQETTLRNMTNVPILKYTMAAVAGGSVPQPATLPRLHQDSGLDGTQARALARIAAEQGRPDEAARWLGAGLSDGASEHLTRFELCRLNLGQGRLDEAKSLCAGSRLSAPFWLDRGIEASDAGRLSEAIAYFDLARATDPNELEAWARLGHALYQAGRLSEAIPIIERLIAVQALPSPELYRQLGEAYVAGGRVEDAVGLLEHALGKYPAERELYKVMAEAKIATGDLVAADVWYARALDRWPEDAFTWAARGELALRREDPATAVTHFERAVDLDPQVAAYWAGLAGAAEANGQHQQAARAYGRVLELRPDDAGAWMLAGRALAAADQIDEARAAFKQALVLQPDNQEALQLLATLDAPAASP